MECLVGGRAFLCLTPFQNERTRFLHPGNYTGVRNDIKKGKGAWELVGTDVNTVQRLTKKHVVEETGCEAYALFSRAALVEAKE
jgi:hypothetical protein